MTKIIHNIDDSTPSSANASIPFIAGTLVIALLMGVGTGFLLSRNKTVAMKTGMATKPVEIKEEGKEGVLDPKAFKDHAEGIMREGGIEGEGSFHLERPGGKSQNVYLTSSTVDLSKYIGKKVKVHGSTQTAQKAGWLMDVGLVEQL